jgi:unsaturated rhamnogalacturonyl hydrolase
LADFAVAAGSDGDSSHGGDDGNGLTKVRAWAQAMLASDRPVEHVNDLAPAAAALAAGVDPARLGRFVEWARCAPRSASGAIEHWKDGLWADTMFMVGVLFARMAEASGDPALLDEAAEQYLLHAQVLQDDRTGLFAHGSHRGETLWNFWGRANAWAALTAVEILHAGNLLAGQTRASSKLAELTVMAEVHQRLETQLKSLASCQPTHGVWDVLVDGQTETAGIVETSAAAGIAAAMIRFAGLQSDSAKTPLGSAGRLALRGALAHTGDDGFLAGVSDGTILQLLPFGYAVIRSDRPQLWGQGLALAAVAAALETQDAPRGPKE